MIFIHTLSLLASPQDQRASAADTIVSTIVIKNNLLSREQSLPFENLIWLDHTLLHLNSSGLENIQLARGKPQILRVHPERLGLRVVKKLLILQPNGNSGCHILLSPHGHMS